MRIRLEYIFFLLLAAPMALGMDPCQPHYDAVVGQESSPSDTWVWLRGLGRQRDHWGNFPSLFADAFPGTRHVLLDLPGMGNRGGEWSPFSIPAIVDKLRDAKKKEVGDKPVCLMGISLGGMVCMDWLARYPGDLASLVLMNPSAGGINPWYERMNIASGLKLIRAGLSGDPVKQERTILETLSNTPAKDTQVEAWAEIERKRPLSRLNFLIQLIAAARWRAPSRMPQKPVLLLNGQGDRLVCPNCSDGIAGKYNWNLERHPSAGHDLPSDNPQWILHQIRNWKIGDGG